MPDNIKYLYEMGKYLEKKSYFKKKKKKEFSTRQMQRQAWN